MVLLAYDGSDDAAAAIKHAGALCAPRSALVVNVWRPIADQADAGLVALPADVVKDAVGKIDGAAGEASEALASEGVALAEAAGFEAEALSLRGTASVGADILRVAGQRGAQLIVLGSRGLSGVSSAMLGSVSAAVTHGSATPVLITPGRATPIGDDAPAVLCYDGSQDARAALTGAGSRSLPGTRSWSACGRRSSRSRSAVASERSRTWSRTWRRRSRSAAPNGRAPPPRRARSWSPTRAWSRSRCRSGPSARASSATTPPCGARSSTPPRSATRPVIVLGARGLSRTRAALLGSVSTGVVTHAARSVLIVPHGSE